MQVPDAIEPAVGYRVWKVVNGRLYSINHGDEWQPHMVFEATCSQGHDVPDPRCACGTYAAATFNRLFKMGYTKSEGLFSVRKNEIAVAGQVNLWGGIVPGTAGWRAQFAYPKLLLVPYSRWHIAKALAETYGVPFKFYNLERTH
jgi:hypothetical protein